LSFVETGRAQPRRELILRLAEELEIPLRERNALLIAAGFAARNPGLPGRRWVSRRLDRRPLGAGACPDTAGSSVFIGATTVFGSPADVTLEEVALEVLHPADAFTDAAVRAAAQGNAWD
jgi:hypothetical protein